MRWPRPYGNGPAGWMDMGMIFFGNGEEKEAANFNFWTKLNQHSRWWFPIFLLSSLPGGRFPF